MTPTIGQTLWLHFTENRHNTEVRPYVVTKIGHKWLTVAKEGWPLVTERVAISDLRIDGGEYSSPGRAYVSKEAFEEEKAFQTAWDKLETYVRNNHRVPANLTLADIQAAIIALKVP